VRIPSALVKALMAQFFKFELRFSEISNSGLSSTMIAGVGLNAIRIHSSCWVPTLEMWKTWCTHGDCPEAESDGMGARKCKDLYGPRNLSIFSWKVFHIEDLALHINVASNLEFQGWLSWESAEVGVKS